MIKYILKRLGYAVLVLLGVSLIIYFLTRLMPIDYVRDRVQAMQTSGAVVDTAMVDAMDEADGLTENAGFFDIKYGVPVAQKIGECMGVSFIIALIATVFEFLIAIPLGITAATHQYKFRDYLVTVLVMIGISLPAFFFGNILKSRKYCIWN